MIARLEPDKRIPERLRGTYAHLAGNVMWTYGALEELMFLLRHGGIVRVAFRSCFYTHFGELLASPLLAVLLFGLLRICVTNKASKRAVHAFACRHEPMPLAVDCSPNTKRRRLLVLGLRPRQTPLNVCSRSKFILSSLRDCRRGGRCMLHIDVEVRRFR